MRALLFFFGALCFLLALASLADAMKALRVMMDQPGGPSLMEILSAEIAMQRMVNAFLLFAAAFGQWGTAFILGDIDRVAKERSR